MAPRRGISLQNRNCQLVFFGLVILTALVSLLSAFNPILFITDRYSWYLDMADRQAAIEPTRPGHLLEEGSYLDAAIEYAPHRPKAYIEKAHMFYSRALDHESAEKFLSPLNGSEESEYYRLLGLIRYKQGEGEESLELLNEAVEHDPFSVVARVDLALAYLRDGEKTQARWHLDRARSLAWNGSEGVLPSVTEEKAIVQAAMAIYYSEVGRYSLAQESLSRSYAYSPRLYDQIYHQHYR